MKMRKEHNIQYHNYFFPKPLQRNFQYRSPFLALLKKGFIGFISRHMMRRIISLKKRLKYGLSRKIQILQNSIYPRFIHFSGRMEFIFC